jgi:hypothetical protein
MLDPAKVKLRFKPTKNQKATIAYCDEYPDIQGTGNDQAQATANFWKQFNAREIQLEHEATERKKLDDLKKAS